MEWYLNSPDPNEAVVDDGEMEKFSAQKNKASSITAYRRKNL